MKISFLQTKGPDDFKGLVTENNLALNYMLEPQATNRGVIMLHQNKKGYNTISGLLEEIVGGVEMLESSAPFTWDIAAGGGKAIPLVEARIDGVAVAAGDKPGIEESEFELVFSEDYFDVQDVIVGEQNEIYPIRIHDKHTEGSDVVYTCALQVSDDELAIPIEELATGKMFSKEFQSVSHTLSSEGSRPYYNAPAKMQNSTTFLRMAELFPANLIDRKMVFNMEYEGQTFSKWVNYATWEMMSQFEDHINTYLMFGRYNRNKSTGGFNERDRNGFQVEQGAGFREQMDYSNYNSYNTFEIDEFEELLLQLSINKTTQDNRHLVVRCGEWGLKQFSKAMEQHAGSFTPVRDNERVVTINGSEIEFRGQYTSFRGSNGIYITFMIDDYADDEVRNKIAMPGKRGLASSYRYDIFNLGTSSNESNLVKMAYQRTHTTINGIRSPYVTTAGGFTPMNGVTNSVASSIDGWREDLLWIGGAKVNDPTRTAAYVPNIKG